VKAYFQLGIAGKDKFNVIENLGSNKFKLSNGLGIEEPVIANLVYQQLNENKINFSVEF
jgi:hypothetical protein